jgi:hypothetical protein
VVEYEDCDIPVSCTSCGVTSSQRLVFGGATYVPLCEFCMEVLKDVIEENLET